MVSRIARRERTVEETDQEEYDRFMRQSESIALEPDTLYAVALVRLHSTVDPSDYPTLKTAIEAVASVQEITLVVDHHTDAAVPEGRALKVIIDAQIKRDRT